MSNFAWVGPSKGAFNNPANWIDDSNGEKGVPGSSDSVNVTGTAKKRITITGNGQIANLYADYLTVAGSIAATGSVQLSGADVVDTGGGLTTGNVLVNFGSSFAIGGFVTTNGNVVDAYTAPITIGLSTGEAEHMGWTVKSFFEDGEAALTVEHGAAFSVSALNKADGLDLLDAKAHLIVTSEGTLTTAGLLADDGARVTITDGARVQATGSNFSDSHSPFESLFTTDGAVSADFEGPTGIGDAAFQGEGAIVIGYETMESSDYPHDANVTVSGSGNVTDSFTLIADGKLSLVGNAHWTAGGGTAKNGMDGTIQVGWFSNFPGAAALLSVAGSATLDGRALTIETDGKFGMSSTGHVVLGSGAARAGAVAIGSGGTLTLDGRSGSYNSATDIEGGSLDVEVAKAAGGGKITFETQGGELVVSKRATVSNTIAGFSAKAQIDLSGVVTTSATFKNNVLTLEDKGKVVETLKFAGSEHLIVASDGKGGTKITFGGKAGVTVTSAAKEVATKANAADPIFEVFASPNWRSLFTGATGIETKLVSSSEYVVTDAEGAQLVISGKNITTESFLGYAIPVAGTLTGFNLTVNKTEIALGTGYSLQASVLAAALEDYISGDKTALADMWFSIATKIRGTSAHIEANLPQLLYYDTHIVSIEPTNGKVLVSIPKFDAYKELLVKVVGGFSVSDTAAEVTGALAALSSAASHITSIATTGGIVTVSAAAFAADKAALNKIVGGFSVSDTAAHIESRFSALAADVARIHAIDLTGASPALSLTAAAATADASLLRKIAGDYVLDVHNANGSWTTSGHGDGLTIHDLAGVDAITGGGTFETFVFGASFGQATITDSHAHWVGAGHDVVELSHTEFASLTAFYDDSSVANGLVSIAGPHGDKLTLDGFSTRAQLHAALGDFKLV